MSVASDLERQMLALINDERTSRGLDPIQLERRLNVSAEDHSEWMRDKDTFSHTGEGGSSPTERMHDAGFVLSGSWRTAENIAWQSIRGAPGLSGRSLHRGGRRRLRAPYRATGSRRMRSRVEFRPTRGDGKAPARTGARVSDRSG